MHTARPNLSPILTLRLILILSLTQKVTPMLILTVPESQFNHSDVPYMGIGGHTVLARGLSGIAVKCTVNKAMVLDIFCENFTEYGL